MRKKTGQATRTGNSGIAERAGDRLRHQPGPRRKRSWQIPASYRGLVARTPSRAASSRIVILNTLATATHPGHGIRARARKVSQNQNWRR